MGLGYSLVERQHALLDHPLHVIDHITPYEPPLTASFRILLPQFCKPINSTTRHACISKRWFRVVMIGMDLREMDSEADSFDICLLTVPTRAHTDGEREPGPPCEISAPRINVGVLTSSL